WALAALAARLRLPAAVPAELGASALGCLAILTWTQVGYWRDARTLWERALAVTANNHRAHAHLGQHYQNRQQYGEARAHFAEAVRLRPRAADYHLFLGAVLVTLGWDGEAAEHLRQGLRGKPEDANAWHNLGVARLRHGEWEKAARCFRKVLELQPGAADALAGLGRALW